MPTILNPKMIDTSVPLEANIGVIRSLFSTGISAQSLSAIRINTNTITSNTLSTANLTATNLKSNNTELINLTAYGDIVTNISVLTAATNIVFNNLYNSKIIHLNTTTSPVITATFPNSLSDGFNVGIVNAGTGTIILSAQSTLNAPGTINAVPYTAIFIYKVNNQFFGIGAFE